MDVQQHSVLMQEIKNDFDAIRKQAGQVQAALLHMASNVEHDGLSDPPQQHGLLPFVAAGIAGHRPFRQRFDRDGNPRFVDEPIPDVDGKPIQNSVEQAFDVQMPAHRSISFHGDHDCYRRLATTAKRAGNLLDGMLDDDVATRLREWEFSNTESAWWAYVFEAAWANVHPHLSAEKQLWVNLQNGVQYLPYDQEQLRILSQSGFGVIGTGNIPPQWLKRLPDAFASEISDFAAACYDAAVYACEQLTRDHGLAPHNDSSSKAEQLTFRKRFAIALSFPGEHRALVESVANQLAAIFGHHRVLYDKFHKEELARNDLDVYLPTLYRDQTDLIVVFGCKEYVEKDWCGLEWRYVRDYLKDKTTDSGNVMMLTVDGAVPEGWLGIDGYLEIAGWPARQVTDALMNRWCAPR